jgi:hypothetical protein
MRGPALGLTIVFALGSDAAFPQTTLGPGRCVSCHSHASQGRKWQIEEPARLGARAHLSAMGRLDDRRAAGFARAVSVASPYAPDGACVRCHATVFRGRPNAGVSCESCHGPSSGWIELHQEKGSYESAVAAGMRPLRGRVDAIARLCVGCHAVEDARLVAAGHPSGASFDTGSGLREIAHWTTVYDHAQVTAAARAVMPRVAAAPPAARETAPSGPPSSEPPAPRDPDRWDAARPLPPSYLPEPAPDVTTLPATPTAAPVAPPERAPSTAEDVLLPVRPRLLPLAPQAAPRGVRAERLERRGRSLVLLSRLLLKGVRLPAEGATRPIPGEFEGPDGELLRLQDEVYALLWEALRRPAQ